MENKQELEEYFEEMSKYLEDYENKSTSISVFMDGAKYQAKKMYTEEDVIQAFREGMLNVAWTAIGNHFFHTEDKWFKQFKQLKYGK